LFSNKLFKYSQKRLKALIQSHYETSTMVIEIDSDHDDLAMSSGSDKNTPSASVSEEPEADIVLFVYKSMKKDIKPCMYVNCLE